MKITEQTVIIDGIDKVILKTLMQDARSPILTIAKLSRESQKIIDRVGW